MKTVSSPAELQSKVAYHLRRLIGGLSRLSKSWDAFMSEYERAEYDHFPEWYENQKKLSQQYLGYYGAFPISPSTLLSNPEMFLEEKAAERQFGKNILAWGKGFSVEDFDELADCFEEFTESHWWGKLQKTHPDIAHSVNGIIQTLRTLASYKNSVDEYEWADLFSSVERPTTEILFLRLGEAAKTYAEYLSAIC